MAMKLHTKDQAPKEGEHKAAEKPFPKVCRCWIQQGTVFQVAALKLTLSNAAAQRASASMYRWHSCGGAVGLAVGADARRVSQVPGGVQDAVRNAGEHCGGCCAARL